MTDVQAHYVETVGLKPGSPWQPADANGHHQAEQFVQNRMKYFFSF